MSLNVSATRDSLELLADGFDLSVVEDLPLEDLINVLSIAISLFSRSLDVESVTATEVVAVLGDNRLVISGSGFSPTSSPDDFEDAFLDKTATGAVSTMTLFDGAEVVSTLSLDADGWALIAGDLELRLEGTLPTTLEDTYPLGDLLLGVLDGGLSPVEIEVLTGALAAFTLDGIVAELGGVELLSISGTSIGFAGYELQLLGNLPDPVNDLSQVLLFLGSLLLEDTSTFSLDGMNLLAPGGAQIMSITSTDSLIADVVGLLFADDPLGALLSTASLTVDGTLFEAFSLDVPLDSGGSGSELIQGTPDADVLYGYAGDDTIFGTGGSDLISGGEGNDSVNGGIGFDTMLGGIGDDTLFGLDGYDSIDGGPGNDSLTGNNGFDMLAGSAGDDTLQGGLGLDTLLGGAGNDLLEGQPGFDSLLGGIGNDTLNGNAGADTLHGEAGDDLLNGGINNDSLLGGDGNDTLNGNNGTDTLEGGAGDDRLEGNAGTDLLNGGEGDDVLRGGIGIDTFVFEVGSGNDRVADFQNGFDVIALDQALFSESMPVAEDIRDYASLNGDGNLVLTFGTDSLTFTGVTNTTAILDDVIFV